METTKEITVKEQNPSKKRKLNTSALLERFFNESKIIYYRAKINDFNVFKIPYEIGNLNYNLTIQLVNPPKTNFIEIGFSSKLNENTDYSKELLDINAEILKGRLSVSLDSSYVTYSHNFNLLEDDDIKSKYHENLSYCFYILNKLLERNVLEKQEEVYED